MNPEIVDLTGYGGVAKYAASQPAKYRRPPGASRRKPPQKHHVGRPSTDTQREFLREAIRVGRNLKSGFAYRDPLVRLVAVHDEVSGLIKFGGRRCLRWERTDDARLLLQSLILIHESIQTLELSFDEATACRGGRWSSEQARERALTEIAKLGSLELPAPRFPGDGELPPDEENERIVRGLLVTALDYLSIVVA